MSVADELVAILGYETRGEAEVKRFEKNLNGLNKKLDKFAVNVGKVAGAATALVATGFGLLGKTVVDTSAQFEIYQATLETIEGSAEKARKSLDWIATFGKTTPYDVAQVTESFVKLKAYGIDPIADNALRVLGDTAAAMGKPLNQAVEAFADAATGEFERLKEFGIKAKTQGDNVTFAWTENGKELNKTVKKNSNEIRGFLLDTLGHRFNGAMDRQSKTWVGMMSNLGDTWIDFQRRIGAAGFFESISGHLKSILDGLGELDKNGTLDKWAKSLSGSLTTSLNVIVTLIKRTIENVTYLAKNFHHLEGPLKVVGVALGLLMMRAMPLITIFTALAFALDDLLAYFQGADSYIGDFIKYITDLTGVSDGVAGSLAGLGAVVAAGLTAAFLTSPVKIIGLFGKAAFMALSALAPLMLKGAIAAFALLSNPIGWAVLIAGAAAGLIYYFWDELKAAWDATSSKVTEIFNGIKDKITSIDWAGVGLSIMNSLWSGMKSVGEGIKNWFLTLIPNWAKGMFSGNKGTPFVSGRDGISEKNATNLKNNLGKMDSGKVAGSVVTDQRQDNREQNVNSNVVINQTITQDSKAPDAAARATGKAVTGAIVDQRSQLEGEPSF